MTLQELAQREVDNAVNLERALGSNENISKKLQELFDKIVWNDVRIASDT